MMLSTPRVSVVIPCYNHGRFLARAVESVLLQSYSSWEAIIVDDGSTDSTASVSAGFTDRRIQYIYQENQGLSAARNTGIRQARGEYIAFLDSDDEWERDFLSCCVNVAQRDSSLAMVYTRTRFIDEEGNLLSNIGGAALEGVAFRERLWQGGFFPAHAALIKTVTVLELGMFDTSLTSLEDWDLWLRLSGRHAVCGLEKPMVRYRVYSGSMSTNAARMHDNRMKVLAKHFGPPDSDPQNWSIEKRRAYGFAYLNWAMGCLQQQESDAAWQSLKCAFYFFPDLLTRLDTFYELACGDQQKGYRGQAERLDIARNGAEILGRLYDLFAHAHPTVFEHRGAAYANVYLALAMLSDQAGHWTAARRYLLQAVRHSPAMLRDNLVWRRLAKLLLGQRTIRTIQHFRAPEHSQL